MPYDPNFGTLTDDDLLSLGRQAGYIPSGESIAPDVPEGENELGQPLVPPSYQLQSPAESPRVAPAPGGSVGVGTSSRGFSEGKYGQVSKTEAGLEGQYQKADARADAGAQRDADFAQYGMVDRIEAEKAKAKATVDQIEGHGRQALVMQRLQDQFSVEEVKANAQATAASNQAKADYLAALADFRAAKVDPAQLWGNMGGDRIGMLATAFVHDFLGAKGIHTSAMDTFNKALDRNIDAQIQAIKTKGEVAEGFKSLWYMQRNQSASDAEARERVRGFMLEGTKQQVIANMAQYESALASAQGQAAIAKIDEELGKSLIEIYRHADTNAIHLRNQALEQWKAKLHASLEQQSLALRQQEIDLKKKELDKKNPGEKLIPIYDPESGEAKWVFNNDLQLKPEEMVKVREKFAATDDVNKALEELRYLTRNGKKQFDPIVGTRFAGTDSQRFDALANRIAHGMAHANGERATDADVEQFKRGFRQASFLNMAEAEKVIAATQAQVLRQTDSLMRTYAVDLPESARGVFGRSARGQTFPGSAIDAENTVNPPSKTTDEIHGAEASKYAAGVAGKEEMDPAEITAPVRRTHSDLVKQYPHVFGDTSQDPTTLDKVVLGSDKPIVSHAPVHKFEAAHVELRRLAAKAKKEKVEDKDNVYLGELKRLASTYLSGITSDDPEAISAAYNLSMIDEE